MAIRSTFYSPGPLWAVRLLSLLLYAQHTYREPSDNSSLPEAVNANTVILLDAGRMVSDEGVHHQSELLDTALQELVSLSVLWDM